MMNNNPISKLLFGIVILCFGMVLCAELRAEEIQKPYEIENVMVTFFWFDTDLEMQAKYAELQDEEEVDEDMRAFSGSEPYPDKNFCHVDIYAVRPQEVDDDYTMSVGHEVLHCVYGADYHEGRR